MQPIKIFDIIARRRMVIFGVVLVLIFGTAVGLAANFFANSKKAHASSFALGNGGYIGPNDTTHDWANTDVTVTASSSNPAAIDGTHTFANLTVNTGATLTTSDYNRYGVDARQYESNLADARDATSLANKTVGDNRYVFIMRGFIYTNSTTHDYYLTSFNGDASANPSSPNTLTVYDSAVLRFYSHVSTTTAKSADLFSSANEDNSQYAMSNTGGVVSAYHDSSPDSSKPIIPFELIYMHHPSDANFFGISSCSLTCTTPSNHTFLSVVQNTTTFAAMHTDLQMQTYQAWQGALASDQTSIFSHDVSITHNQLVAGVDSHRANNVYQDYYFADNYDFSYDPKVYLGNSTNMLDNPAPVAFPTQYDYGTTAGNGQRSHMFFRPTTWFTTPLATRYEAIGVFTGFPEISLSLFNTMHSFQSKKTDLTVNGALTIASGGQINVNGKGFSPAATCTSGSIPDIGCSNYNSWYVGVGPGAGFSGAGASHSGRGGDYVAQRRLGFGPIIIGTTTMSSYVAYDDVLNHEPKLPGSGASSFNPSYYADTYLNTDPTNYYGYGGGYIKIQAKKIIENDGASITANAVGGNAGRPMAGASGGSIILADQDATSSYSGNLTAMGGSCREGGGAGGGGHCFEGGGGGGHIYLVTATDSGSLSNSSRITSSISVPAFIGPGDVFTNDTTFWNLWTQRNIISVAGGANENGAGAGNGWGAPGTLSIIGSQAPMAGIRKIVEKVDGTSPYNLKPGDQIRITLHVTNLVAGQPITIRDEFFNDGVIADAGKFTLTPGSDSCTTHTGGGSVTLNTCTLTPTASDISWAFTPSASQGIVDLQYNLLVK